MTADEVRAALAAQPQVSYQGQPATILQVASDTQVIITSEQLRRQRASGQQTVSPADLSPLPA